MYKKLDGSFNVKLSYRLVSYVEWLMREKKIERRENMDNSAFSFICLKRENFIFKTKNSKFSLLPFKFQIFFSPYFLSSQANKG